MWKHDVEAVRARPGEDKGHERIGLLARVTPGRLGTDLSNAQSPEAQEFKTPSGALMTQEQEGMTRLRGKVGAREGKTSEGSKPMGGSSMKQGSKGKSGTKRQETAKV